MKTTDRVEWIIHRHPIKSDGFKEEGLVWVTREDGSIDCDTWENAARHDLPWYPIKPPTRACSKSKEWNAVWEKGTGWSLQRWCGSREHGYVEWVKLWLMPNNDLVEQAVKRIEQIFNDYSNGNEILISNVTKRREGEWVPIYRDDVGWVLHRKKSDFLWTVQLNHGGLTEQTVEMIAGIYQDLADSNNI